MVKVTKSISLKTDDIIQIENRANKHGLSFSKMINEIIREYFEEHKI